MQKFVSLTHEPFGVAGADYFYAMHSFNGELDRSYSAATLRNLASAHPAPATGVPPHPLVPYPSDGPRPSNTLVWQVRTVQSIVGWLGWPAFGSDEAEANWTRRKVSSVNPTLYNLSPKLLAFNPKLTTVNRRPWTLNPQP